MHEEMDSQQKYTLTLAFGKWYGDLIIVLKGCQFAREENFKKKKKRTKGIKSKVAQMFKHNKNKICIEDLILRNYTNKDLR